MTDVPTPPVGAEPAESPTSASAGGPAAAEDPRALARARARARRRKQQRRRRFVALVLALLVVALVVVGGGWWWVARQVDPGGKPGAVVTVQIPKGASTSDIGKLLAAKGVIPNGNVFRYWVRYRSKGPFEAGRYRLPTHLSDDAAIALLEKGPPPLPVIRVTIPEGFTVAQIVARLHQRVPRFSVAAIKAALAGGKVVSPFLPAGSHDYEGLLYPATYDVIEGESVVKVLNKMTARLLDEAAALQLDDPASGRPRLSRYELIKVASLVQAEAGNPDEAPKIARVIYNRLQQGMVLGIDATSRYLSSITGDPVDFESASPYNTRRQAGLPPTPITAPGEFALRATLHPAAGDWLYYVRDVHNDAKGRPQHVFTASEAEFERAKQACHDAGLGCG